MAAEDHGTDSEANRDEHRGGLDRYEKRSRLQPALLTIAPLGLALTAIPTGDQDWLKPILGLVSAAGGSLLLAAIARSLGRAAQDAIFPDGLPTLLSLRHRGGLPEPELIDLHAAVSAAAAVELPTAVEEANDPVRADSTYTVAISRLISRTRGDARFRLLREENHNYGFLRNLYGLRGVGKTIAVLATIAGCALTGVAIVNADALDIGLSIVAMLSGIAALWVFFVWLTPERVVVPANAYRDRLFEAARTLP